MMADAFTSEYQRICQLINGANVPPCERKKALAALLGIRNLLEGDRIDSDTASSMASKLATALRFAVRSIAD